MSSANFVLLREGTSDEALLGHLRTLLVRAGFSEATGTIRPYKPPVEDQLSRLEAEDIQIDLVFIHRDADSRDGQPRVAEIQQASEPTSWGTSRVVPVVPVQTTETWLILDEAAIRDVVGRPSGRVSLGLPKARSAENSADPKALLRAALLAASETTGRRHKQEQQRFSRHRRALLERLDIDGPVSGLSSWAALVAGIERCAAGVLGGDSY